MKVLLVLCLIAGTCFCDVLALPMDESVALGYYDRDVDFYREQAETSETRPRLEAEPAVFAQALSRDYRPVYGTLQLTKDARFYILCDDPASDAEITPDDIPVQPVPDKELRDTVSFASGLFADAGILSDEPLEVAYGTADGIRDGDIIINMKGEGEFAGELSRHLKDAHPEEAYELDADDHIYLSACTADGIYYGLISLMEILASRDRKSGEPGITLECFRMTDAPVLRERAIFIDCARKYFSKDWLINFIKRSSIQRYNTIVLHFSEAECMRLDSEAFPWLTEGVKSLSREEMKEIVEAAQRCHMDVIPSIDTPGHNRYMVSKYSAYVKKHPEFSFTYDSVTYDRKTRGFGSIANHYSRDGVTLRVSDIGIDITKAHAVAFSNAVIDDYAEFFRGLGCSEFDICGDEIMGWSNFMLGENQVSYENRWLFLKHWSNYARDVLNIKKGSASDAFIDYLNSVCTRLESMGYHCRVFNDEIDINKDQHVELRKSIDIVCWDLAANSAKHFADAGHTVHNGVMQWTYYVVRRIKGKDIMNGRYKTVNARNIYDNWDPRSFSSVKGVDRPVEDDRFGGGYFFIWCDEPDYKSAETVMEETELRTWANACRMWNPEVNSGRSGIRAAMQYENLDAFVQSMGKTY